MVYLLLAEGFEELEAIAPLDVLRRAGVAVKTVGITGRTVTGSHGIPITCDLTAEEVCDTPEAVILPGGKAGTDKLAASSFVRKLLCAVSRQSGLLAAICAAPSVLGQQGYLKGKRACCYPGFETQLTGAQVVYDPVAVDGNVITSRGAGTALQFGLALAEYLTSTEKANEIAAQIQLP